MSNYNASKLVKILKFDTLIALGWFYDVYSLREKTKKDFMIE